MIEKGAGPVAAVWSENALERARLRRLLAANCCASLAYDSAAGLLKLLASGRALSMIVIGETGAGASESAERIRLLVNPRTGNTETLAHLYRLDGNRHTEINSVREFEVAVAKADKSKAVPVLLRRGEMASYLLIRPARG